MITPAMAPNTATTKLSVNICRTSLHCVAPSAPRIASSFARNAARPNCMFITFTQAISNTRTTAAEHCPDGLTKLDAGECIQQRLHASRRQILICLGVVRCQMASKRNKLRIRLINSHTRLEPAHDCRCIIVRSQSQVAARLWRKLMYKGVHSSSEIGNLRFGCITPMMVAALPLILDAFVRQCLGRRRNRVARFVAQDSDLFRARFVVLGSEIATKHRRDTDNLEKIFGYVSAGINAADYFCK